MTQTNSVRTTDVLIVGSGIAGCAAALAAARAGAAVLVITKASRPADAATDWAQGGVAVSRSAPEQLTDDIITASDGTADPEAVELLVRESNDAVSDVLVDSLGVPFDRSTDDTTRFDYTREAGHSESRILHVDAETGRHVLRPFLAHLRGHDRVQLLEETAALELLTHEGRVHGAVLDTEPSGEPVVAGATVLATGGIGGCYPRSINPPTATGDGIAMAALAGAETADMEYVQFHPTALAPQSNASNAPNASNDETLPISEAVRGAGGTLRNAAGEQFMCQYHDDGDLAPRDVVARAVARERAATGTVRLDVSSVAFDASFPELARRCRDHGVDPAAGVPVAPAEHFLCGGIAVDDRGRSSLDRLFAVGECARTGVHGATRLASTSLLEGLVWGLRAGETAAAVGDPEPASVTPPTLRHQDPSLPDAFPAGKFERLRRVMGEHVGLQRDPRGLRRAATVLRRLKGEVDAYIRTRTARELYELRNASVVGLLVARAGAANTESVGCHHLADTPAAVDAPGGD
ncbi:MAG: aspartate oxidase [halophilic archaeon J07HX5]|jgi:L-aspartate oxidase (EC 1.4.3.16)|nr:MAG: aspartate oxidase [halophilic archaeon J07HX5]